MSTQLSKCDHWDRRFQELYLTAAQLEQEIEKKIDLLAVSEIYENFLNLEKLEKQEMAFLLDLKKKIRKTTFTLIPRFIHQLIKFWRYNKLYTKSVIWQRVTIGRGGLPLQKFPEVISCIEPCLNLCEEITAAAAARTNYDSNQDNYIYASSLIENLELANREAERSYADYDIAKSHSYYTKKDGQRLNHFFRINGAGYSRKNKHLWQLFHEKHLHYQQKANTFLNSFEKYLNNNELRSDLSRELIGKMSKQARQLKSIEKNLDKLEEKLLHPRGRIPSILVKKAPNSRVLL